MLLISKNKLFANIVISCRNAELMRDKVPNEIQRKDAQTPMCKTRLL